MATATANAITFLWEGMDRKGSKVKGESQAASEILLKADLRRQGINPLKVKKKSKPLFGSAVVKSIIPRDIAIFARQLATMMTAGVSRWCSHLKSSAVAMTNLLMQDLVLKY